MKITITVEIKRSGTKAKRPTEAKPQQGTKQTNHINIINQNK